MSKKDIRTKIIEQEIRELKSQEVAYIYAKMGYLEQLADVNKRIKKIEEKIQKLQEKL